MHLNDQAVIIFAVAVFGIFSAVMAYATWLGGVDKKPAGETRPDRR